MPSAIRFMGMVCFGLLAALISEQVKFLLDGVANSAKFTPINAILGMICGWYFMTPKTGEKIHTMITAGMTTVAATIVWGLLLHSIAEMFRNTSRMQYSDTSEAVIAVFDMMLKYATVMAVINVFLVVVIGGVLGGLLSGWAHRHWG